MNVTHRKFRSTAILIAGCAVSLTALALLSVAAYNILDANIRQQDSSAYVINTSGRQRMYSQRIGLLSWHLLASVRPEEQLQLREQLRTAIAVMERAHFDLLEQDKEMRARGAVSPAAHALYFDPPVRLDFQVREYLAEAKRLAQAAPKDLRARKSYWRDYFSTSPSGILDGLDSIVAQYQKEAEAANAKLQELAAWVMVSMLVTILLVGVLIFLPMILRIRKETRKLERAEERSRTIMDVITDAILMTDEDGRINSFNLSAAGIFGYPSRDLQGLNLSALLPELSNRAEGGENTQSASPVLEKWAGGVRESVGCRQDGATFAASAGVSEMRLEGRRYFVCSLRDISERKEAEDKIRQLNEKLQLLLRERNRDLQETQESYQHLASILPVGILRSDPEGKCLTVNERWCEIAGQPAEEALGEGWAQAIHPEDRRAVLQEWYRAVQRNSRFQSNLRLVHRNQSLAWAHCQAVPEKDDSGHLRNYVMTVTDITEDKKAEGILRNVAEKLSTGTGEAFFPLLVEHLAKNLDTEFTVIASLEEGEPGTMRTLAVWEDGGLGEAFTFRQDPLCGSGTNQNACCYSGECELHILLEKMGTNYCVGIPLDDSSGRQIGMLAALSHRPIKDRPFAESTLRVFGVRAAPEIARKKVEEALRESEEKFRLLVEHAPYGVFRLTPDGHFLGANRALVRMLAYDSEEDLLTLDDPGRIYMDPADRARLLEQMERSASHEHFMGLETTWRRKNGDAITVQLSGRMARNGGGNTDWYEVVAHDITQERALETQLRQSQKMEAIGQLAGGVAHDFNNLLMVIRGYSEMLLTQSEPQDSVHAPAVEIAKAADKAASLTRQLLAFSRKQVLQPRALNLNSVVGDMEKMLKRLIGENILLSTALSPDLASVRGDPTQIQQVLLNLTVNSRDAMPEGGQLTVTTKNVRVPEHDALSQPPMEEGDYVLVTVADTGTGMDEETLARIFDPFFTTKEKGKGTGLGLSTVYGIVKQSQGYIWTSSEPGKGTTFRLYFPQVSDAETSGIDSSVVQPSAQGTETVLLVEDEGSLRALVRSFLTSNGYHVLEAGNGADALRLARHFDETIHVLITDIVMPEVGGRDLAEEIIDTHPEIKVLYISGHFGNAFNPQEVLSPGKAFLQKPFSLDKLALELRHLLEPAREEREADPLSRLTI